MRLCTLLPITGTLFATSWATGFLPFGKLAGSAPPRIAMSKTPGTPSTPSTSPSGDSDSSDSRPKASLPLVILSTLAIFGVMYVARDIIIPLAFAILLALLLRPAMRRMRHLRLPDMASALILITAVVVVFSMGVLRLAGEGQKWLAEAPQTVDRVRQMLPAHTGPIANIQKTTKAVENLAQPAEGIQKEPVAVKMESQDAALTVLGVSGHFLGAAVIVFVVGFFLLAFSDTLLRQAIATRGPFQEKRHIVQGLQRVETGISRYLVTITIINAGLGVATGIAMWVLGIPNPVLWGVMAATLNYVPHVGAMLCMIVLFFVGSVTHGSIGHGAVAAGTFLALTSLESYLITPMVLSRSLQLSPLAVILAILLFGWMWGVAGGLIAAPLITMVKIVCDQFESLRGAAAFLGGTEPERRPAHLESTASEPEVSSATIAS